MNEIGWNECMTQVGELLWLHIIIEVNWSVFLSDFC